MMMKILRRMTVSPITGIFEVTVTILAAGELRAIPRPLA
jgi:hypothetical protein